MGHDKVRPGSPGRKKSRSHSDRASVPPCVRFGLVLGDYLAGQRLINEADPNDPVTAAMVHVCVCPNSRCNRQSQRLRHERPAHYQAIQAAIVVTSDQQVAMSA